MDIQEHLEHVFAFWNLLFEVGSDKFDLSQTDFQALRVVVCEKVPVHVLTLRIAAIVAGDDAIRVHDRRDPKLKHIAHLVADDLTTDQEVDKTVDDEGRMRLATVLPTYDKDHRLLNRWVGILTLISDLEHWDIEIAI